MPVRLTIAAVIAAHGGLDQAGAVAVAATRQRQANERGMREVAGAFERLTSAAEVPRDRVADHLAQFLLIHRP